MISHVDIKAACERHKAMCAGCVWREARKNNTKQMLEFSKTEEVKGVEDKSPSFESKISSEVWNIIVFSFFVILFAASYKASPFATLEYHQGKLLWIEVPCTIGVKNHVKFSPQLLSFPFFFWLHKTTLNANYWDVILTRENIVYPTGISGKLTLSDMCTWTTSAIFMLDATYFPKLHNVVFVSTVNNNLHPMCPRKYSCFPPF